MPVRFRRHAPLIVAALGLGLALIRIHAHHAERIGDRLWETLHSDGPDAPLVRIESPAGGSGEIQALVRFLLPDRAAEIAAPGFDGLSDETGPATLALWPDDRGGTAPIAFLRLRSETVLLGLQEAIRNGGAGLESRPSRGGFSRFAARGLEGALIGDTLILSPTAKPLDAFLLRQGNSYIPAGTPRPRSDWYVPSTRRLADVLFPTGVSSSGADTLLRGLLLPFRNLLEQCGVASGALSASPRGFEFVGHASGAGEPPPVGTLRGQTMLPRETVYFASECRDFAEGFGSLHERLESAGREAWDAALQDIEADGGPDVRKELIPALGPEWGCAIVDVDPAKYGLSPKYRLPALVLWVECRRPDLLEAGVKRLIEASHRKAVEDAKQSHDPSAEIAWTRQELRSKSGARTRIRLVDDPDDYLGSAFDPGYAFIDGFWILTTFHPLLETIAEIDLGKRPGLAGTSDPEHPLRRQLPQLAGEADFALWVDGPGLAAAWKALGVATAPAESAAEIQHEAEARADRALKHRWPAARRESRRRELSRELRSGKGTRPETTAEEVDRALQAEIEADRRELVEGIAETLAEMNRRRSAIGGTPGSSPDSVPLRVFPSGTIALRRCEVGNGIRVVLTLTRP